MPRRAARTWTSVTVVLVVGSLLVRWAVRTGAPIGFAFDILGFTILGAGVLLWLDVRERRALRALQGESARTQVERDTADGGRV